MLTIYKKELKQLFTGMIGFIFIAFVLLFSGIYLTVNNLRGYYPNVEAIFSSVSLLPWVGFGIKRIFWPP